jgi:predicted outer membrane repeat protein
MDCTTYLNRGGCFFHSFLIFINYIFFISFSPGIFYIYGNLSSSSPSSLTDSTFANISFASNFAGTNGGAVCIDVSDGYSSFTIDCCVFTECKGRYGGALYLGPDTPYIYISRTRFENNDASTYGDDIYVFVSLCFNLSESGSLASSVCSTTPSGDRLNCGNTSQLLSNCLEKEEV